MLSTRAIRITDIVDYGLGVPADHMVLDSISDAVSNVEDWSDALIDIFYKGEQILRNS